MTYNFNFTGCFNNKHLKVNKIIYKALCYSLKIKKNFSYKVIDLIKEI